MLGDHAAASLWGFPFPLWPIGHQSIRTRDRINDRELCTACGYNRDSPLGDGLGESAQLYSYIGLGPVARESPNLH